MVYVGLKLKLQLITVGEEVFLIPLLQPTTSNQRARGGTTKLRRSDGEARQNVRWRNDDRARGAVVQGGARGSTTRRGGNTRERGKLGERRERFWLMVWWLLVRT